MVKMGDTNSKKGVPYEQLRQIWNAVGTNNWLETLQKYSRDSEFFPSGQDVLKGKCIHPDHADTDPSAYVYIKKGYYKCFGCGYYERNPIVFLKHVLGVTQVEALQYLTEKFKIKVLSKKALAELEAQQKNHRIKQEIYRVTHLMMCDAIGDPTNKNNAYAKLALDYLINTRKIAKDTLHTLPVGIIPELQILSSRVHNDYGKRKKAWDNLPELNRPDEPENLSIDVYGYLEATVDAAYKGALVFPMHTSPADIGRLKLRAPVCGPKKKIRFPADDFEDFIGLYGLGWDQYQVFTNKKSAIDYMYVTEGEFDVLSLMSKWVVAGRVPFPIVAAGGSGGKAHIEPILESSGFSQAYLIGDSPKKNGNLIVGEWLEHFNKMDVKVFSGWSSLSGAGDLDEAVTNPLIGEKKVEVELLANFKTNFSPAWQWNFDNMLPVLDNIDPDDFRILMETAARAGKILRNNLEQIAYCDAISHRYNLNASLLRREITAHEDTQLGFRNKCEDALRDIMYVVGNEIHEGRRVLVLFIKKTKELHRVRIDSDQFAEELANIIGTVYDFVETNIGLPGFLENPEETEGLVLPKLDSQLKFFLKQALISMTQGSPIISSRQYRQGYHNITLPSGDRVEYIVCGSDIYQIQRDSGNVVYRQLEGPSHNGLVFSIHEEHGQTVAPWYPGGLTPEILEQGKTADLKAAYEDLVNIFDCAFTFKHQKVTCQLLASLMLVLPINNAFSRQLLAFITGDTGSGKSTLLSMFSNIQAKDTRLLYASEGKEGGYTTAGVADSASCSALLQVLDEFEVQDAQTGEHVPKIFEMWRGLVSGACTRTLGQPGGKGHRTQYFNMPVFFAAIQGADRAADLNRLLVIEMKKIENKDYPSETILRTVGMSKIMELRQTIATGMYPHALTLAQYEQEMRNSYSTFESLIPFSVSSRLSSGLFIVMSLMKHIGVDYTQFYKDYMLENADIVQRATSVNESDSYLRTLLGCPITLLNDGNASRLTIRKLLMDSENRHSINNPAWGTYYDEDNNYLLLLLDTVMHSLIPPHLKSNGMMTSRLKEVLGRHKLALAPQDVIKSGILRKVAPYLGAGIKEQEVVVIHAKSLIADATTNSEIDMQTSNKQERIKDDSKDIKETLEAKDASEYEW
jgi:hypothetical protein